MQTIASFPALYKNKMPCLFCKGARNWFLIDLQNCEIIITIYRFLQAFPYNDVIRISQWSFCIN